MRDITDKKNHSFNEYSKNTSEASIVSQKYYINISARKNILKHVYSFVIVGSTEITNLHSQTYKEIYIEGIFTKQ